MANNQERREVTRDAEDNKAAKEGYDKSAPVDDSVAQDAAIKDKTGDVVVGNSNIYTVS